MIVDDHTVIREGLSLMLSAEADLEVIGAARNGRDAVEIVTSMKPDVVIMDLNMPVMNGADAIKRIRGARPEVDLLVLSSFKDEHEVLRAIDSGAHVYLFKDGPTEVLERAIRNIYAGRSSLNPEIASTELRHLSGTSSHRHDDDLTSMEVRGSEMAFQTPGSPRR
jgi:DNA-binding NarL/FixJ family response regulator